MADTGKITKRILAWAIAGAALFGTIKGINAYQDKRAYDKLPHDQKVVVDSLRHVGKPEEVVQKNIDAYNGIVGCITDFEKEHQEYQAHFKVDNTAFAAVQVMNLSQRLGWMYNDINSAEKLLKEITAMSTVQQKKDLAEAKAQLIADAQQVKARVEEVLALMQQGKIKVWTTEEPDQTLLKSQLKSLTSFIAELSK